MMSLLFQIPIALIATFGFCIIFNVPAKKFPLCALVGAVSWMSCQAFIYNGFSPVFAAFAASCIVWLMSNICSRIFRETSTMFIIPGILCLVPGSGMYYTMLAMLHHDMDAMAPTGTVTLMTAGAIAAGLLAMGSVTGVIILFINRVRDIIKKRRL